MRKVLVTCLFLAGAALASCDDDEKGTTVTDGPLGPLDAAAEMGSTEAGPDTASPSLSALPRPSELLRPPNGRLPPDLLPPSR